MVLSHFKGFTINMSKNVSSYLNRIQMQIVHIFQAEINYFKSIVRASLSQLKKYTLFTLDTPLLKETYSIIGGANTCMPMVSSCGTSPFPPTPPKLLRNIRYQIT